MELSIVLFSLLNIFQVQCEGWYQQQPRRRYSHPLRPLKNNRHYNTESYHQQSPSKPLQNIIPHRTDSFAHQSSSNHYSYQINHNIKPSTTVSFSHYIPYKYYGYQPYQIYTIYKTESFGSHSLLPSPINTFNLNDHPINGQYKCQVCYKCWEDTSSEESFESFEDSWSRTDIVVLYRHNNKIYKVGQENVCPLSNDLCCCKVSPTPAISFLPRPFRPSWSTQNPNSNVLPQSRPQRPGLISPQPQPPKPSYIPPKIPSWKPSPQTPRPSMIYPQTPRPSIIYPQTPRPPMIYPQTPRPSIIYPQTPRPSMIYPQTPFWTPSIHPPNSSYIPPNAPSWKPSPPSQSPRPPMIYPHIPIFNQSPLPPTPSYLPPKVPAKAPPHQPEPPRPTEMSPSPTANCTCTPFFRCYDEETSSNLTGAVDDRDHNTVRQEICPSPNDVCCYNPVKSSSVPTSSNPSPQPQPPNPTHIVPSPDANCTCTPFFRCYDEETSSNLTGDVDDRNHISERQESCPSPNDVCCFNLVTTSVAPQTISPFIPSEPDDPISCTCTPFFRCYDEETSSNLTDVVDDRHQESCTDSNDVCCYNLVQPTQAPPPPQTSLYPIDECTCTPFFRCYDEETGSNLTGNVDDRNEVQTKQESCPNPNDVCCYNLVEISPTYSPGILAKSLSLQHDPLSPSLLEGSSKTTDRHHGSSVWEYAGLH